MASWFDVFGSLDLALAVILGGRLFAAVLLLRSLRTARPAPGEENAPAPRPRPRPRMKTEASQAHVIRTLQAENRYLSNIFVQLPGFTKQLNSPNLEKRNIGPLLIQIIDYLFYPEQVMIFTTGGEKNEHLILVDRKGTGSDLPHNVRLTIGQGRIGWVAQHQVAMSKADFAAETQILRLDGTGTPLDSYMKQVELCAPMVHDNKTLGVIALSGLRRRPKNEKSILKMLADLGSIGIHNASLFKAIQMSANSDGLTGLMNKRHFLVRLGYEINKAEETQSPLSVFLFDLDHFKNYNDVNGHLAGDEALKITGRLMRTNTRADDIAARYGGEEFVVVLPNTTKDGAYKAAEKLRNAIEDFPFPNGKAQPMGRVTISGGVASFPMDGRTSTDLIGAADEALYRAKKAGRNRVQIHQAQFLSEDGQDVVYVDGTRG
jgi:diguanylate cyclase (GGDEF)-like protein